MGADDSISSECSPVSTQINLMKSSKGRSDKFVTALNPICPSGHTMGPLDHHDKEHVCLQFKSMKIGIGLQVGKKT